MPAPNTVKHLELTLDDETVECDLTGAVLTDEPEGGTTATTFCGSYDLAGTPKYSLTISGYQSYESATHVASILHAAYVADPAVDLDVVLTVGTKTRSFSAFPAADVPFGSDTAGEPFTFESTLNVTSDVTDGTVTP